MCHNWKKKTKIKDLGITKNKYKSHIIYLHIPKEKKKQNIKALTKIIYKKYIPTNIYLF